MEIENIRDVKLDEFDIGGIEACDVAISALRSLSRERVEKLWKGDWLGDEGEKIGVINGSPIDCAFCSSCGSWLVGSDEYSCDGYFCPSCGKAMTDNAVDIVIGRLEELYGNRR